MADLRARAVTEAGALFAEHGYANVTIDDVAARLGVSRATLYRHVGGHDDLALALTLRRFAEWVDAAVRHAARFDHAGDMVTEVIVFTLDSVRRDESLRALFRTGAAGATSQVLTERADRAPVQAWRDRFGAQLATDAAALRTGLDPLAVADRVLGVMFELLSQPNIPSAAAARAWIRLWLLPAVLEERPPIAARSGRSQGRKNR